MTNKKVPQSLSELRYSKKVWTVAVFCQRDAEFGLPLLFLSTSFS